MYPHYKIGYDKDLPWLCCRFGIARPWAFELFEGYLDIIAIVIEDAYLEFFALEGQI